MSSAAIRTLAASLQSPRIQIKKIMMTIKKFSFLIFILPLTCCSQIDFNKISKEVDKTINGDKKLTSDEIIRGLKEALTVGSNNASGNASKLDGFFKNPLIKIPFPPDRKSTRL